MCLVSLASPALIVASHVLALDPHAELTALALYNVEPRALQFEDVLQLSAPHLAHIAVPSVDGTAPSLFAALVVQSPLDLRINGKHLTQHEFSAAEVLINPVRNK